MSDAPGDSTTGTGSALVSTFQTQTVALMATRRINWLLARPDGAAFLVLPV